MGADLKSLTKLCGTSPIKGIKTRFYTTATAELNGWPETAAEGGGTAQGDTKILDEPFTFVTTVGLGYWRSVDILVDTGEYMNEMEGDIGGQEFKQRFSFFILGDAPAQREFVDVLLKNSGCLINLIQGKNGDTLVQGNLENPVFVQSITGGRRGTRVGYEVTLFSAEGFTYMTYDAATHGIDITPAA